MDCEPDDNQKLCQEENVKALPTLKLYFEGKDIGTFSNGERNLMEMVKYVEETIIAYVDKLVAEGKIELPEDHVDFKYEAEYHASMMRDEL